MPRHCRARKPRVRRARHWGDWLRSHSTLFAGFDVTQQDFGGFEQDARCGLPLFAALAGRARRRSDQICGHEHHHDAGSAAFVTENRNRESSPRSLRSRSTPRARPRPHRTNEASTRSRDHRPAGALDAWPARCAGRADRSLAAFGSSTATPWRSRASPIAWSASTRRRKGAARNALARPHWPGVPPHGCARSLPPAGSTLRASHARAAPRRKARRPATSGACAPCCDRAERTWPRS